MAVPVFATQNDDKGNPYVIWPFNVAYVREGIDTKVYVDNGCIEPQSEFVAEGDFASVTNNIGTASGVAGTYFAGFALVDGSGYVAIGRDAVRGIRQDPANANRCYIATSSQVTAPFHVASSASAAATAIQTAYNGGG